MIDSNPPDAPDTGINKVQNATDSGPVPDYAIEKCRGHWHVTSGGEALIGSYDTPEEAQRVADQNNAGDHSEPRGISNEEILNRARKLIGQSDSGELEQLLDDFGERLLAVVVGRKPTEMEWSHIRQHSEARKSVLDLFERLQNRIAELESMLAGFDVSRSEEDHGIREAASIGELEADRARLDWLVESGAIVDKSNESAQDGEPWMLTTMPTGGFGTRSEFYWGATAREVIDKARLFSLRSSSLGEQK